MPRLNLNQFLDDEYTYQDRQQRRQSKYRPNHKPKRPAGQVLTDLAEQSDTQAHFDFTYQASRHEHQWIIDSLGPFYEAQWIDDVLRLVQGGKEATVYQCAAHATVEPAEYIAAKVYRPRQFRQLKKDHIYREGRVNLDSEGRNVTNHGMLHAMAKRTDYGLELLHTSWIEHEFNTLNILHQAGADVPLPLASGYNTILMGFMGDAAVSAPTLNTIHLGRDEAHALFRRVVRNIELMLANQRVHGDLSAYNILYWEGRIALIDFPQAINPHENPNAYLIFQRDVRRICEYFAAQGLRTRPGRLAASLWTAYGYHLMPEINPALLDDQDEADRRYWDKMVKANESRLPQRPTQPRDRL